jgi:hypothetical protein
MGDGQRIDELERRVAALEATAGMRHAPLPDDSVRRPAETSGLIYTAAGLLDPDDLAGDEFLGHVEEQLDPAKRNGNRERSRVGEHPAYRTLGPRAEAGGR